MSVYPSTPRKPIKPGGASVLLLYHFFDPDDVVSARQYTQLAASLAGYGWTVTVVTSNRYLRHPHRKIEPAEAVRDGVRILRVGRPAWPQTNPLLRLGNAAITLTRWVSVVRRLPPQDAIVLGTDPQFAAVILPHLKRAHPGAVLAHWCFDLYPEAIMADAPQSVMARLAGLMRPWMRRAYRALDVMVDIGPCMRRRLAAYQHGAVCRTIVPAALFEPSAPPPIDRATRESLFGDAELALLYSGTLGKAHEFETFLAVARAVRARNARIVFCFACTGQREAELKAALTAADYNVRIAAFCDECELEKRLACADIHLLSLRPQWEGLVVPSKFFGSLAMGKPVLYAGAATSDIALWIKEYDVGCNLAGCSVDDAASLLLELADNKDRIQQWQTNAWAASHNHFSKALSMSHWHELLTTSVRSKSES